MGVSNHIAKGFTYLWCLVGSSSFIWVGTEMVDHWEHLLSIFERFHTAVDQCLIEIKNKSILQFAISIL